MLTIAVLGAVEVHRDGQLLRIPTGKTTELLVRLAIEPGSRVRADALIDDLWSAPVGRNTLQSKVSQLRRALGDRDLLVGSADTYALAIEPGSVDAFRAMDFAAEASAARKSADAATALHQASAGLALFRGEALVDSGDWATPHRARLSEVHVGLIEAVMAARIDLGSGDELVGELQALVERYPLRESLWGSLITALYRAGRQADALAAYTRVRRLLVDELGIEPSAGLHDLEWQVLQQSPALGSSRGAPVTIPGNLPGVSADLVGRGSDVAALTSMAQEHRLVTVVGAAGVGKTRLAIEVAAALAATGGVWLVRLDAADASSNLVHLIEATLHVTSGEHSLVDRLTGSETVLVLDNCEHLVDAVSALVRSLLDAAPQLRIVTTSQVALGLDGEHVYQLEPLSTDNSVALFAIRARTMRRQFVLDAATTTLVEEVCRSLDGLPLAIELAAARVRSLSLQDIARRLEDRFTLLQDPISHRPQRSRALSSAIAWSYDLLFPDDQRGLWALSCFAATASLDAVEHVLVALDVPVTSVVDTISRLVDRSLVSLDVGSGGAVRYRLLDSIRAYAADRLRESGQAKKAAAAHAAWYVRSADWCAQNIRSSRQPECVAIARAERENIDSALSWCAVNDPASGVRIANGFGWTWVVLGEGTSGAARVRSALTSSTPSPDRAAGLLTAGWLEASAGDVALAEADLEAASLLADEVDDDVLRADAQRHKAFLAIQQGRALDVLTFAEASLAIYRPLGLQWPTAASLLLAAFGSIMVGDTAAATRDATEAVGILTPIEDSWGMVHAEAMLGGIAQAEHRFDDAARALARAAEASQALGFVGQAALHLASLGRVQQRAGDADAAVVSLDQAVTAATSSGDGRLASTARLNLARHHRALGDHAAALSLLQESQRWYLAAGGGEGALLNRCLLAAESNDGVALAAVLEEARVVGNTEALVYAWDALAYAAALQADQSLCQHLLDEADALAPTVAHLVDEADRLDRARAGALLSGLSPRR